MRIKVIQSTQFIDDGKRIKAKNGEKLDVSEKTGSALVSCGIAKKIESKAASTIK